MRDMHGKVVVVTGASSGLGRATAVRFAELGCDVALAARRQKELDETAELCRASGGRALVVVTDVTREDQVQRLAQAALTEWGRIDVWVNNAGVTLFARLADVPFEEHRRVLETNVHGAMFGARAVLPVFKRQKSGVLINVGSVLSEIGQAFVPSYVISKFALRGVTEAVRVEIADEPDIHACSFLPYTIDTQHFQSGGNAVGREAYALPPVQSPEKVARAIVALAQRPKRQTYVPTFARLGLAVHALFPRTTERLLLHALRKWHFSPDVERSNTGNLYSPAREKGRIHGVRAPRIGTAAFLAWVARDLLRMELDVLRSRLSPRKVRAA
jgi:NAD(P)-dependent dehydrogenase (short-subunit alcohol dehydrogenase family)